MKFYRCVISLLANFYRDGFKLIFVEPLIKYKSKVAKLSMWTTQGFYIKLNSNIVPEGGLST